MAGTEGAKIPPNTERPKGLRHNEILDRFTPVNSDPAYDAAAVYWQAKTDWTIGLETFRTRMNTAIAQAWEGNAAEASKTAINTYTTKADTLTGTFETVARLITDSAGSAVNTKSALPERKPDPDIWDINDRWINNDDFERERADDEETAQAVMTASYVNPFATIDNGLPVLDHPTSLVDDSFVPTGGGDDDDDTGGGGGTPDQNTDDEDDDTTGDDTTPEDTTADDTTPEDTTADDTTPEDTTDDGDDDETADDDDDTGDDTTDDNSDGDTNPSSTQPAGTTPATTPDTKPTTPSSPGSPGGGTPAATPGTTINPGRVTPGMPTLTTPTASVAAGATAGATGRGMMSPGMMGGAGGARGNDNESTRETPEYLINEENARELIGDVPNTPPQALGAHFPSAQTRQAEGETT
ncbi:hypothetical protein ACFXK0_26240 [Nocardia sp. NPDC059177]|uniref:hypothetical protein n=1 Tax=Nocardia sp. NPDC059177 TaxID=3346759 RepID=UPI00368E4D24